MILTEKQRKYDLKVKVLDDYDLDLLNQSQTTGMIQFGKERMSYPKFWMGEEFLLPFEYFNTVTYDNVNIETIEGWLPYAHEGNRIKISDLESSISYDKVFSALNYGGDVWQHIIQDVLPMIILNLDVLQKDEEINILLYNYEENKKLFDFLFSKLNLKNKIISVPYLSHNVYKINKFYNFECNLDTPCQWWPLFVYETMNKLLTNSKNYERKNIIYNKRNYSRKILNESELIIALQEYATHNNLTLIVFESENFSFEEVSSIYGNAHTIVAPHGGANYNIIFSNPEAKFVEYVFIDTMYTLCNLAGGIGLNYFMIPNRGNNNTSGIHVDINKLNRILYEY